MTEEENPLLDRVVAWARADANVVALIMTGSRARIGGHVDEFSDFDLEIICERNDPLVDDDAWLRAFAPILVYLPLREDQPYPTRLVFYEGGSKVDFTLATRQRIAPMIAAPKLDGLYERGYIVLLDKHGVTAGLPAPTGAFPKRTPPAREEFLAVVTEFWFEAAHIPRYLLRDELWVVKFRDWTMKEMLLRMLEWHAVTQNGEPVDVWHIGAHNKEWLDEQACLDLYEVFARFDAPSSWRALLATTQLFRRLTNETATALGIDGADETAARVSSYIAGFEGRMR